MKAFVFSFAALIPSFIFFVWLPKTLAEVNESLSLPVFTSPFLFFTGIMFIIASVFIIAHAFLVFRILGKGTPAPVLPPKYMVKNGLYGRTRNPMYLAYLGIFLGEFFVFGHISLLAYALFMMLLMHLYVVLFEEPDLKKRFGEAYAEYAKHVPRWI